VRHEAALQRGVEDRLFDPAWTSSARRISPNRSFWRRGVSGGLLVLREKAVHPPVLVGKKVKAFMVLPLRVRVPVGS
jgi:hypothetical protein